MNEQKPQGNPLKLLLKYPFMIGGAILLTTSIVISYRYLVAPVYTSVAVIQEAPESRQTTQVNLLSPGISAASEQIRSEAFITDAIQSNPSIQTSYFIETDYRKEPTIYRFPYQVSHRVIGNQNFGKQNYSIQEVNDNIYRLTGTTNGTTTVKQGTYGEEIMDNNLALTITKKEGSYPKQHHLIKTSEYKFSVESPSSIASNLLERNLLDVNDQNGIIVISCSADHPEKARQLASVLTAAYTGNSDSRTGEDKQKNEVDIIEEKLDNLTSQMTETETQIASFKKLNRITDITIDTETSMAVMKELELQKTQLVMKMATLDNLSNYLRKNRDGNNSLVEYETIDDPAFAEQISRLNQKYQQNPSSADAETEQLKNSISERILNTRKKTAIQIQGLALAIQQNQKKISNIPEKASALLSLNRKLELDKKVYDLLSEKRAQLIVDGNPIALGSKIIKPATLPVTPSAPVSWMLVLVALAGTLTISWPLAYARDKYRVARIRNEAQIKSVSDLPIIGSLVISDSNLSSPQEDTKNLCARVMMMNDVSTITVTSASEGEGKSTTVANIALAFSSMDKKVLVIDMNLHKPQLSERLSCNPQHTLAEVINGECDIHDALCLTSHPNLEILVPGNLMMGINSWLSSPKRWEIMATIKKHYDYIIIDTPNVTEHIDALPFLKSSDLTIFAIKSNSTHKQSISVAEELKSAHQIEKMVCVLTSPGKSSKRRSGRRGERTISVQRPDAEKQSLLRRIALWFY